MYYKKELGENGEDIAYDFLKSKGYSIINRNYKSKIGEIDIIALDESKNELEIVFVEVKTRVSQTYGFPAEAVDKNKARHIFKVAEFFLMINKIEDIACRFDVIEILTDRPNVAYVHHIENAFDESFILTK